MPSLTLFRRSALLAASVAAAAAAGALGAHRWALRTQRRYPPLGQTVVLPSGPAQVIGGGNRSGPPLVLVHGSDGVGRDWILAPLWAFLAPHYHLIAPDRLGHGYTPPGDEVTVAAGARQLREVLDALGLQRATVVGHSYGGPVALALAAQYPERVSGLVLISPVAYAAPGLTRSLAAALAWPPLEWLITRVLLVPVGRAVVELEGRRAFAPAPMPQSWRQMMLAFSLRRSQVLALAEENRTLARELRALAPTYGKLQTPLAVIAGDADALLSAQDHAVPLAAAVPNARLTILAGGHQLHWTHPQDVAAAVQSIIPSGTTPAAFTGADQ